MVVDLGDQPTSGLTAHTVPKIYLQWELENVREQGGLRVTIGEVLVNTCWPDSKLVRFLEEWRGRALADTELAVFDLSQLLGKRCTLFLKPYSPRGRRRRARIQAITRPLNKRSSGQTEHDLVHVDLKDADRVRQVWADLPAPCQRLIRQSRQWRDGIEDRVAPTSEYVDTAGCVKEIRPSMPASNGHAAEQNSS